jgi:SAM-dependent methyltransferase
VRRTNWSDYLASFHATHAGVTERAFARTRHPVHGNPYEWLVRALGGSPTCVLDAACGNAAVQPRLPAGASYVGVDLSRSELAAARHLGRGPVVRADLRSLPLPDGTFDAVVSSMGLMLVLPVERAVDELARVLRPGGMLALLLPASWPVRRSDIRPLAALMRALRGPGSMPQQISGGRAARLGGRAGLRLVENTTSRFSFPLSTPSAVHLAVHSLYTPGRTSDQLARAERALRRLGPAAELPVPLRRVVAVKSA